MISSYYSCSHYIHTQYTMTIHRRRHLTMAASKVSLKLLIDKKGKKVLFAEAGKDFVDFLFTILGIPVGTVIRLLAKQGMVGCLANLYDSVEGLSEEYMQPNHNREALLKPKASICNAEAPIFLLDDDTTPTAKRYYRCLYDHNTYVADNARAVCPSCGMFMSTEMRYVAGPPAKEAATAAGEKGFVKGVVTYMVMDDLVVKPMSTISSIALLNQFNVKDVGALEEKTVYLDMTKGLKLLKMSLQSKAVLTSVFLRNRVA